MIARCRDVVGDRPLDAIVTHHTDPDRDRTERREPEACEDDPSGVMEPDRRRFGEHHSEREERERGADPGEQRPLVRLGKARVVEGLLRFRHEDDGTWYPVARLGCLTEAMAMGRITVAVVCLLVACGDDDTAMPDARSDAPSPRMVVAPAPPMPATRPRLTPCPEGWRRVEDDRLATRYCEPFADPLPSCGSDQILVPGQGCVLVGDPCPEGEFAPGLPADTTYVDEGATAGDGTATRPFGTIDQAIRAGATRIALGKGSFEAQGPLDREIVGACASSTTIVPHDRSRAVTLLAIGSGGRLRNARVEGARLGVIAASLGASFELDGVAIERVAGVAVFVEDASLVARRLRIDAVADASTLVSTGVAVTGDAQVTLEDVSIAQATVGVIAQRGARVTLVRGLLRDPRPQSGGGLPRGITAEGGARVEVARSVLFGPGIGLYANDGELVADDLLVRGATPDARAVALATAGGTLELSQILFDDTAPVGISADGGSHLVLRDVLVRRANVDGRGVETYGVGTIASEIDAERVAVRASACSGVVLSTGSTGTVTDLTIADITGETDDPTCLGFGLSVHESTIDVQRIDAFGVSGGALDVSQQATLHASDLVLHDGDGRGVNVYRGTMTAERIAIERVAAAGIGVESGIARLTDVLIADVAPFADGSFGLGAIAQFGSELEIERGAVSRVHLAGVVASNDTRCTLRDVAIASVAPQRCEGCSYDDIGLGIGSQGASVVALERFLVRDAALCGFQIAGGATVQATIGEIVDNEVGICVTDDTPFDTGSIGDDVLLIGNRSSFGASRLPIPELTL